MSTHQPTEPLAPVDTQPVLGLHGEPCAVCGAPLAADQRYCLCCGARRADARLPFRDILAARERGAAVPAPAPAAAPHRPDDAGRRGTIAALAGLGVVLLALGMGVLIGNAGKSDSAQTAAPQVINLGTAGAAATPAVSGAGAAATSKAASAKSKAKNGGSSSDSPGGSSAGSQAKNPELKSLEKLSPEQYQKKSQKLPKVVGTGGAPPPKDNKPAAGGGDFQEIE